MTLPVSLFAPGLAVGTLLHASGWQTINWLIFPSIARIFVPQVWQSARKAAVAPAE